jgi:drug/metabolite transporter (DMT)-like permease
MPTRRAPTSGLLLASGVLVLFFFWSQSFLAIEALLRPGDRAPRFDWLGLTSARFGIVSILCATYLALFRRGESLAVIRAHWRRLVLAGLFCVPGYNFALYWGQQHRVAAPVASLLTALAPLFVMGLSAAFLSERITYRRAAGFVLALSGLILVARSGPGGSDGSYPMLIGITALAPLSWSIYTVLTKPISDRVPPLVWTYLSVIFGTVPTLIFLPGHGWPQTAALDGVGWLCLGHLVVLSTVVGFALWIALLARLPATSLGFTIFLNPPMTTGQKLLLSLLFPAVFAFSVTTGEIVGGVIMLAGVGVATLTTRADRRPS